ncbi:MAG: FKBP-type peptidyl-prolyl cis-trans isomerase [Flavobacteriales bacterium]|nr:FKBP-type peptidyl-prolyl cis-trans isomerase [Flavobacteriales bacterium]
MRKVTDKDVVKLKYKLTVHDGTVVEDSGDDAVDMIMGKGLIIPGFEKLILGTEVGYKVEGGKINKLDAFGEWDKSMEQVVELKEIPREVEIEEGGIMHVGSEGGQGRMATVKEIYDDFIILDFNHPLVGKNLLIDFEILDIYTFDPENPPAPPKLKEPEPKEEEKA